MQTDNQLIRRKVINVSVITSTVVCLCLIAVNSCFQDSSKMDQYGGSTENKLTKTGFFHTENDGSRWWFVTPAGNAFLSFGGIH